ncbi:MAG: hypothetical protein ACR2QE_04355 [Acidimicrobiales bacterium]
MDTSVPDRLMPRHEVGIELPIDWDTGAKRRFLGRAPGPVPALIREISLLGALVDAPLPPCREVGDRVEIRMQGRTGLVEIRHARPAYSEGRALYGVMFADTRDLDDLIHEIVGYLRTQEDRDVDLAWQKAH